MPHDRDHDDASPVSLPPRDKPVTVSRPKPDSGKHEHPAPEPREPVDPKIHPTR